jgi:hypothetical protein
MANMTALAIGIAAANPIFPIRNASAGMMAMPPKLAPVSARLMARPRRRSNQAPRMLVIAPTLMADHPTDIRR